MRALQAPLSYIPAPRASKEEFTGILQGTEGFPSPPPASFGADPVLLRHTALPQSPCAALGLLRQPLCRASSQDQRHSHKPASPGASWCPEPTSSALQVLFFQCKRVSKNNRQHPLRTGYI